MKVGSLFAGGGGFDLAVERMGWSTAWASEIEPRARQVFAKHFPNARLYGDVADLRASDLEPVDILCSGSPCQDISFAGLNAGIDGRRSGLYAHWIRLLRDLGCKYGLMENVRALLVRGLGTVLGALADIGYDAEWHCFPASDLGAPHVRERAWILAYPHGTGGAGLVQSHHFSPAGSWGWHGETDLQSVAAAPFEPGNLWPQPLLRRMDDGLSGRVDRLRIMGNAIVPDAAMVMLRAIEEHARVTAQVNPTYPYSGAISDR